MQKDPVFSQRHLLTQSFSQQQHGRSTVRASSGCLWRTNWFWRTAIGRVFNYGATIYSWRMIPKKYLCISSLWQSTGYCVSLRLLPPGYQARTLYWTWWYCSYISPRRTKLAFLQHASGQVVASKRRECAIPRNHSGWKGYWMMDEEVYIGQAGNGV